MPKLIDIVKALNNQVKSDALNAAVGASEPFSVEFEEEDFAAITEQVNNLMTAEKAANSQQVIDLVKPGIETQLKKTFKANSLDFVEKELEKIGKKLDIDLNKDMQHYEQLKALDEKISSINFNGSADTSKFEKEISSLHGQLKEKDELLEKEKTNFNTKLQNFQIDSTLRNHLGNYKLQEAYTKEKIRSGLFDKVISDVKGKYTLKLGEDSSIRVFQKDNPELEAFGEGNQKLGINEIFDSEMKEFLQASTPKEPPKQPQQQQQQQAPNGTAFEAIKSGGYIT